ncbi:invasion associated locus B family protein [Methyloligella halotolerans]|nr:invasion associated locus B family protein [Methyloligella halotolerans]
MPVQAQSIATPVKPNVSLPGGASSLTETHEDWTVGCSVQAEGKRCVFSQALGNKQTGQRLLSMELRPEGDGIEGVILAPFGLRLAKG